VYVHHFLEAMERALADKAYGDQIAFDIIFMAAAIRADTFAQTLRAYRHRIRNFRAFAMHDDLEVAEILVQMDNPPSAGVNELLAQIYRSSLLYFISAALEDNDDDTPLAGMDRYRDRVLPYDSGTFPYLDDIRRYIDQNRRRLVLSDTSTAGPQPPLGLRCGSHHHGGFPGENGVGDRGGTLESVCYLLRTGAF
jgi:hypothetical protein